MIIEIYPATDGLLSYGKRLLFKQAKTMQAIFTIVVMDERNDRSGNTFRTNR